MEATKTLEKDPQYIDWLHQLTVAGYDRGVIIEADHAREIEFIYHQGLSIDDSLLRYANFKRRGFLWEDEAIQTVLDELIRHKDLGYSDAHDDTHTGGELAIAAAIYAVDETSAEVVKLGTNEDAWPGEAVGRDKPEGLDRLRKLVISTSLIIAELRRELRLHKKAEK